MAHERFDDLSRNLARATGRRQALKVIAGAAIGALFGLRATAPIDATTPNPIPSSRPPVGGSISGTPDPVIPRGKTLCGGVYVDVSTDPQHCGTCAHACPNGQACAGGACVANCPAGQTNCGGTCRQLSQDNNHCGACNVACPPGKECQNGACVAACPHEDQRCGGTCTNLGTDVNNCGSCGTACPQGAICLAGQCQPGPCTGAGQCGSGFFCEPVTAGNTQGQCTPLSGAHCAACVSDGDCGSLSEVCFQASGDSAKACHIDCSLDGANACPSEYTCSQQTVNGNFRMICMPNVPACVDALGGYCTSPLSPPQSCGRTNVSGVCTGQRTCLNTGRYDTCGAQTPQCRTDCSMQNPVGCTESLCASATSTPANCGACGNVCPGYQQANDNVTCNVNQICTFSCQGEHYDVDNNPANGCEKVDTTTGNHTQVTAAFAGSVSCNDTPTSSFSGMILSDRRVHESPSIIGFDTTSGSAPDWYSVNATGGITCQDDIVATITTTGGSNVGTCYKLTIITDKNTYATAVSGSGSASINHSVGQYSDNSTIYFKVEKTCSTSTIEAVNYTVTYHL